MRRDHEPKTRPLPDTVTTPPTGASLPSHTQRSNCCWSVGLVAEDLTDQPDPIPAVPFEELDERVLVTGQG